MLLFYFTIIKRRILTNIGMLSREQKRYIDDTYMYGFCS